MALTESMIGSEIFTQDGERLGKLKEVRGGYFKVDASMQPDYWLAEEYIGPSSGVGGIQVSFAKDALEDYKLGEPEELDTTSSRAYDETEHRSAAGSTTPMAGERESMELREEQLRARTEPVQAGEVTIGKEVVTEQQHMDVPVTHEEVFVERHPVAGGRPASGEIREGEEITVPVNEERVHVEKQAVVTEEVNVGKREVTETEHVSAEVRREEARIEREGDVRMAGMTGGSTWADVSPRYRQEWQTRYGATGRWEDYEPGYRYGHEMANDPRYQGRDFAEVENDLHRDYASWSTRSGYQHDESAWDRIKNGVRDTFNGAHTRRAA